MTAGQAGLFAQNAAKMAVDLAAVDTAIISHGHYDHGGGLGTFLEINKKAKVYLHQAAFGRYYAISNDKERYIGLAQELKTDEQLHFVGDQLVIDGELAVFAGVAGQKFLPAGNKVLYKQEGALFVPDGFIHELNLIINEKGKILLLSGCSHRGIVNILEHYRAKYQKCPDVVIGGFHLYNPTTDEYEEPAVIAEIGEYFKETGAKYYTCHCTGWQAYQQLKTMLGDSIEYLSADSQLII